MNAASIKPLKLIFYEKTYKKQYSSLKDTLKTLFYIKKTANELFGFEDPIGKSLLVGDDAYRVIGVIAYGDSGSAKATANDTYAYTGISGRSSGQACCEHGECSRPCQDQPRGRMLWLSAVV